MHRLGWSESPPSPVILADACRATGWDWLNITSSLKSEQRETGRRQNVPGYYELCWIEGWRGMQAYKLKDRERELFARATCSFGSFADTHLMKFNQMIWMFFCTGARHTKCSALHAGSDISTFILRQCFLIIASTHPYLKTDLLPRFNTVSFRDGMCTDCVVLC